MNITVPITLTIKEEFHFTFEGTFYILSLVHRKKMKVIFKTNYFEMSNKNKWKMFEIYLLVFKNIL